MAFTNEWDETKPQDSERIGLGAGRIRGLKKDVRERLAVDHNFKATEGEDADIGKHKHIQLIQRSDDPSNPSAGVILYDKDGKVMFRGKTGDAKEITNNSDDQTIAGTKTFSSIPVLPSSDPTEDNQATRKKYVDDKIGEGASSTSPIKSDYEKNTVYQNTSSRKIQVIAWGGGNPHTGPATNTKSLLIGSSNPPDIEVAKTVTFSGYHTLTCIVPPNWYFKFVNDGNLGRMESWEI